MFLYKIDEDDENKKSCCRSENNIHCHRSSKREAKDDCRENEEHEKKVGNRKPSVSRGDVAQALGKRNRPAHEGNRIEEEDTCDVEAKMYQSYLNGLFFIPL